MATPPFEVVLDCIDPQLSETFWRAALGYRSLVSLEEIVVLVPDEHGSSPVILQRVPEAKSVKNRMHLDLVREDIEGEASRLVELGARRLHDGVRQRGPVRWITMLDPVGNEFCISTGVDW